MRYRLGWGVFLALSLRAETHFHHVLLNSTDPAAAIEFYTRKFDCERGQFDGKQAAVWAQKSWLLFNKVKKAPDWELNSAIWHIGWGAEDMPATYKKQVESGTKFYTPITDISDLTRFKGFYYAYVDGPDHALIELNTAGHHRFGHLHLFSADPIAAGQFYMKHFGVKGPARPPSAEVRMYKGFQVGPSMSLMADNVNIIIFPFAHARQTNPSHWTGRSTFTPTRGRVIDHIGFSVDHLDETLAQFRKDGVKITQKPRKMKGTNVRMAMVEGPDQVSIAIVEGHAKKQ